MLSASAGVIATLRNGPGNELTLDRGILPGGQMVTSVYREDNVVTLGYARMQQEVASLAAERRCSAVTFFKSNDAVSEWSVVRQLLQEDVVKHLERLFRVLPPTLLGQHFRVTPPQEEARVCTVASVMFSPDYIALVPHERVEIDGAEIKYFMHWRSEPRTAFVAAYVHGGESAVDLQLSLRDSVRVPLS